MVPKSSLVSPMKAMVNETVSDSVNSPSSEQMHPCPVLSLKVCEEYDIAADRSK